MRSRIRNTMMILCFALILSFVSCSNTRVDEKKQIYIGAVSYTHLDVYKRHEQTQTEKQLRFRTARLL